MPTFPSFDLSKLDLSKFELPKLDLPTFDLPKVDLPKFDLPNVDLDRVAGAVRDTAYVGVGLTVLAVQRAQVARRELTALVERQATRLRDLIPV